MQRLAGKLALITGGNSGIGLATGKAFAESGARVAITGRDQNSLDAAKDVLGSGHLVIRSDTSDLNAIDELYATIKASSVRWTSCLPSGVGGRQSDRDAD